MFNVDNNYRVEELVAEDGAEFILASLEIITWEEYEDNSEQRHREIKNVESDTQEVYY
jgi:hypothetical protein